MSFIVHNNILHMMFSLICFYFLIIKNVKDFIYYLAKNEILLILIKYFQCVIESENFQRFMIRKMINLELKCNKIEKLILQKVATSNVEEEDKENIDIFENLPLKDENNLKLMETKLKNDSSYRNQMVRLMSVF